MVSERNNGGSQKNSGILFGSDSDKNPTMWGLRQAGHNPHSFRALRFLPQKSQDPETSKKLLNLTSTPTSKSYVLQNLVHGCDSIKILAVIPCWVYVYDKEKGSQSHLAVGLEIPLRNLYQVS